MDVSGVQPIGNASASGIASTVRLIVNLSMRGSASGAWTIRNVNVNAGNADRRQSLRNRDVKSVSRNISTRKLRASSDSVSSAATCFKLTVLAAKYVLSSAAP
jgi:hypothetical protein